MLTALARDLAGWPLSQQNDGFQLQLDAKQQVMIGLRTRRLFMASIISSHFSCRGEAPLTTPCRIEVHQPGWLRRRPVRFRSRQPAGQMLAAWLNGFPQLRQTLAELDYRALSLTIDQHGWCCVIEPWAASEVICRMPPLRRYLRLEQTQRVLLLSSLKMLNEAFSLLGGLTNPESGEN